MRLRFPYVLFTLTLGNASGLALVTGCSSREGSTIAAGGSGQGANGSGNGSSGGSNGATGHGIGGSLQLGQGGLGEPGTSSGGGNGECRADFADAELKPAHLAFALDVSGSMGKLDKPYHDPELKWRPVVSAVRAFFEDAASTGLSASLTFFPAEDDKCDMEAYLMPDVAKTALPSAAFGNAITAVDPKTSDDWRGGTPTLAVTQGSFAYLEELVRAEPGTQHALVLVTDGYPQGCDDDEIESVVEAIEAASVQFPTYVIGVKNPDGGPDTVSDLDRLAVAGGTTPAIFIDTGDPDKTASDLATAIARIRERSASCEATIPATPGGTAFDPVKVNVSLALGGTTARLGYDQSCEAENSWRYDDAAAPTSIVLCGSTCEVVQSEEAAKLSVEFGCVTRPVVR